MISQKVLTRGDAGNASVVAQIDSYYQDKEDDYYSREDQPSQWQGKLAEELNLTGEVSKLDFVMLIYALRLLWLQQAVHRKEINLIMAKKAC